MSPWKWQQLEMVARHYNVNTGIGNNPTSGKDSTEMREFEMTNITNERHHLLNRWMERRREKIFDNERHAIDTSVETLQLLNIIIYNVVEIETSAISLPGLITLGKYLRTQGHRVDFVKLDTWLQKLHLRRMSSFIASLLIQTLNFEEEELPFLYRNYPDAYQKICEQLAYGAEKGAIKQSSSFATYSPLGFIGYWQRQLRKALDSIEE